MSIVQKIVGLILTILIVFVIANLYFLQFFTGRYFIDYLENLEVQIEQSQQKEEEKEGENTEAKNNIQQKEIDIFDNLLDNPDITPEALDQLKEINEDLRGITQALDKYVENDPKINREILTTLLVAQWVSQTKAGKIIDLNSLRIFLQNTPILITKADESAERNFVIRVLSSMLGINVILILIFLAIVYIATRKIFSPIDNINKNIERIIKTGTFEDIDYQRNDEFWRLINSMNTLNQKLWDQEEIRKQFLTDMSHELKTPMAAIRVYLEWIQEWVIKLTAENTQSLIDEIKRLTRIVESMMFFQKFEENSIQINPKRIILSDTFEWMSEYYSRECKRNKQSINFDGITGKELIFDKDYFIQISHNIMSNFIKYAGKWSRLRINILEEGKSTILIFEDNGKWVHKKTLPFLKEKFYQVDQAKTGSIETRGIGVGLSIVERIVKAAGGFVEITSGQRKGFMVRIDIPHLKTKI